MALTVALVTMPTLILAVPVLVLFYLPIYLAFVLSFLFPGHAWRGMRWSLRFASAAAFLIRIIGVSNMPHFGGDVGGSFAGASYNFAWTWMPGVGCTVTPLVIGLLLHAIERKHG